MSRRSLAVLACAAVLSGAGGAVGSPPPPPPENMDAAVDQASCGATRQATPAVQVPAVVTPLAPESMGVRKGRLGKLTWKIVSVLLALWTPLSGESGAVLQWVHVPDRDDVRMEGEQPEVVTLARLPRRPTVMASISDRETALTTVSSPSTPVRRDRWTSTPSPLAEIDRADATEGASKPR